MSEIIRDRYQIQGPPDRGGQAKVLQALDQLHDRQVALKIYPITAESQRELILREARVLLALPPHPHLPLVREDFFLTDDQYCIVMDWIDGQTLAHYLETHGTPSLPYRETVTWLEDIGAALTHLHEHRPPVVHADIKPSNIIIRKDNRAVLVDFGISSGHASHTSRRIQGTRGHIAPEILSGEAPTIAADIYALAATTYVLLTGRRPLISSRPDLSSVRRSRRRHLERTLRLGLAIDPSRRPASAQAFLRLLRGRLHRLHKPVTKGEKVRTIGSLGVLLLLGLLLITRLDNFLSPVPSPPTDVSVPVSSALDDRIDHLIPDQAHLRTYAFGQRADHLSILHWQLPSSSFLSIDAYLRTIPLPDRELVSALHSPTNDLLYLLSTPPIGRQLADPAGARALLHTVDDQGLLSEHPVSFPHLSHWMPQDSHHASSSADGRYLYYGGQSSLAVVDTVTPDLYIFRSDWWIGPLAIAQPSGDLYVTTSPSTITRLTSDGRRILGHITLSGSFQGDGGIIDLAIDPGSQRIFALTNGTSLVHILDLISGREIGTIPIGSPTGLFLDGETHTLYVALHNDLVAFDSRSGKELRRASSWWGSNPLGFRGRPTPIGPTTIGLLERDTSTLLLFDLSEDNIELVDGVKLGADGLTSISHATPKTLTGAITSLDINSSCPAFIAWHLNSRGRERLVHSCAVKAISPDGLHAYMARTGAIEQLDLVTGETRLLVPLPSDFIGEIQELLFDTTNSTIVLLARSRIFQVKLPTGALTTHPIWTGDSLATILVGDYLAFSSANNAELLRLFNLDTGEHKEVRLDHSVDALIAVDEGRLLAFSSHLREASEVLLDPLNVKRTARLAGGIQSGASDVALASSRKHAYLVAPWTRTMAVLDLSGLRVMAHVSVIMGGDQFPTARIGTISHESHQPVPDIVSLAVAEGRIALASSSGQIYYVQESELSSELLGDSTLVG